jgi:hypothetical protein
MMEAVRFERLVELAEVSTEPCIGTFLAKGNLSPVHFSGDQRLHLKMAFKRKWN